MLTLNTKARVAKSNSISLFSFVALVLMLMASGSVTSHPLVSPQDFIVPHDHVCIPRALNYVEREIRYSHRQAQPPNEVRGWTAKMEAWADRYGPDVVQKSLPSNGINCHGETFDNSNSWIDDPTTMMANCTSIEPPNQPAVGDVVIYVYANQLTHSGRVIETPPGNSGIWIHSKWGKMGDFDHPVDQVPQNRPFEFIGHTVDEGPYGDPHYYSCT